MGSYQLYPEAESDLEDVWLYTVKTWGVEQAITYIDKLEVGFQLLADNPYLSRERKELSVPVHIHRVQHHLVVYLPVSGGISVVRVLHENMDYESLLGEVGK